MFTFTSRKFYDEFTGTGGGGVEYLNALQGDKITCVLKGYFFWAIENKKFIFDSATKTITLAYSPVNGLGQTIGFINAGFSVDDTFDVVGTSLNDGSYTIASIEEGIITTVEALVDEPANNASVYGTTLITNIDFLYDLIPNNSQKSDYVSATDKETLQKYSATGLDAAVATPVPMTIATKSYGWVTDIVTGEDGEGTVEGDGITDYKQKFIITHVFYMTRIWTKELINNFVSRTAPSEYNKGNHLKHICKVEGKFDQYNPLAQHIGSLFNQKGQSGWFNQMNNQGLPEYTLTSIQYQNDATAEYIDQVDASIETLVTISLYSRSGKFVQNTSKFILNHFLAPLNESVYVDTDTTLLENIRLDKKILTSDAAAVDGINFGTDYQSLKDIEVVWLNANNVVITFIVDYSSATKTILANRSADDRLYCFFVSCQDIAITTTKNIDRVNVIADFKALDYDNRETTIFGILDYFHCFNYPNYGVFEVNAPIGYQGDPSYVEIPFWIETNPVNDVTPTLEKISIDIVATKTDNTDFLIETKVFDIAQIRKLDDVQTIEIESSRGFILPSDSPWNRANIIRYEDGDSGTKICYLLQYGYVLRYEEWIKVVSQNTGFSIDVYKNIEDVVQAWKRYSTGNGWALQLRLSAQAKGYNNFITKFQAQRPFTILEEGDAPEDGNTFKSVLKYFNEDGVEVPGLLKDAVTRIVATFGGDPTIFPADMTAVNGYAFVDDEFGSIFTRRFASTDFDSEETSPFSTEDLPTLNGVISSIESANLRITEFYNRFEIDTWFTPDETTSPTNKLVQFRLGYNNASILLQESGSAIQQQDNFFILL